ncbi:fumarylacetoacetase [[Bacillus] enclensis]|uniref:2-keto-4-pentenoate hydratase/2-oxohepta-3-ene-1,7-dioic acid hydratase (Catechol pathway) n=1 Tax=[Bacillus] enclensis TaxID=1402860 RepID=A0A0V8HHA1_9BACI|nr:fumarylacetoacetate hydrolase family protein [[Bacillus] enclensis]KSU61552.1 fumarylacetoacetase [[Bacillus] enclensis]SCC18868.1 2-keto-4-pentenoate hydratase/2-oxohepta-3-ene-1,7-dioic acid hydratase (catechol pathway) [[Bacillus] enclensis]
MKLVSFQKENEVRTGLIQHDLVIDLYEATDGKLPKDILALMGRGGGALETIADLGPFSEGGKGVILLEDATLKAPIPIPVSIRDFYAFEEHVRTARRKRGLDVVPEWYDVPVFYFTNHLAVKGPDEAVAGPAESEWLDYELEIACVIGKEGRNIAKEDAEDHIFGYFIMNDWSARDIQKHEMKVGLGPAKGKDFATSFGPYLVTKDELETRRLGDRFDMKMTAKVNGKLLSEGNFKDIHYTFADMIERASKDVTLYPGEVIGSGTVGTGCILELGTETHRWLRAGDEVELEIEGLGVLRNTVAGTREEEKDVLPQNGENTTQTSHHV